MITKNYIKMCKMIFRILMPFGILLVFLILIPLYFFNWQGLLIGGLISSLILLFVAIKYELIPPVKTDYSGKDKSGEQNDN